MPGRFPLCFRRCLWVLGLVVAALDPCRAAVSWPETQDYQIEVVGPNEGLPANSITDIAQTAEGYLWAGTLFSGLLRYDGVRFVSFNSRNTPELPGNAVRKVMTDRSGLLWISGYDGSLTTWDRNGFSLAIKNASRVESLIWSKPGRVIFALNDGRLLEGDRVEQQWKWRFSESASPVRQLCADAFGRVWVLRGRRELSVWEKGRFRRLSPPPGLEGSEPCAVAADHEGSIWVGTVNSLFRWESGSAAAGSIPVVAPPLESGRFVDHTPPGEATTRTIRQITASGKSLWIETDAGFRRFASGQWLSKLVSWEGGEIASISRFAQGDGDGGFWTADNKLGLVHIKPNGSLRIFSTHDGLPGNSISTISRDKEGNTWLGYFHGGMVKLRPRLIRSISREEGFGGALINSVCEDAEGAIWIGAAGTGVFRFKDGRCDTFALQSPVSQPNTLVTADRANRIWVCSHGGALMRFENGQFVPVVKPRELPHFTTLLWPARDGRLWVGALKSIGFLENDRFTEVYTTDDFTHHPAAITETSDGTIRVGTFDGYLMRWDGRKFVVEEPPNRNALGRLWSLCPTSDGGMWIGTSEGGVVRWKSGDYRRITTANGLRSDCVLQVQTDLVGNLWMVTGAGIERIEASALAQFEKGALTSLPVSQYARSDGLLHVGGSIEFQPNCWRGHDGRLWFAMGGSVASVQPADVRINPVPPTVAIEELRVNQSHAWPSRSSFISVGDSSMKSADAPRVTVRPGQRDFEFRFTGISFRAPHLVQFQYRLEGFEEKWHAVGVERWARYYSLPPGNYTFRVKAANSDNIWTQNSAALALTLLPYFYQTAWFEWVAAIFATAVVALVSWFASRRRMRRRVEVLETYRKLEQDRARIARDMHDELGSKLTRISYISEMARLNQLQHGLGTAQIDTIAETSRDLLRSMDEIVWAVNPRNDTLEHLAAYLGQHANEYFQSTTVECRTEIPTHLPHFHVSSELRHNVFLSFRECLTNILKHSHATQVLVEMKLAPGEFQIRAVDNGTGMIADPRQLSELPASGADGIRNMQQRLEAVGGVCRIESLPGCGTTIYFSIPLKEARTK